MNGNEFKRWLKRQGCTFELSRGKGSHVTVPRGSKITVMPMHSRDLPIGTIEAIKKQLDLKGVK